MLVFHLTAEGCLTTHRVCSETRYLLMYIVIGILITVQRHAKQSSLFINLRVHSTCFGCQPHPSPGVHKTVTTASGIGQIFCAAAYLQRGQASLATLEAYNYSFVYS